MDGEGGVGKQTSGMATAERKHIIPMSVAASTDPLFVCLLKAKTRKTTRFFSSYRKCRDEMRKVENRDMEVKETRARSVGKSQATSGLHIEVRATWQPRGKGKYLSDMFQRIRALKIKASAQETPSSS